MNHFDQSALSTQERFAIQSWQYQQDSNYHSLLNYIDWMFAQRSRLLVIRIDLSFRSEARGQYDAEYARDCFQKLLSSRRYHQIFSHLIGYVWAMEHGAERGFHYHCIFCFDGHERQKDMSIGYQIGQYWREVITQESGYFYCCNDDITDLGLQGYPIGIGMIHRNSQQEVENMVWMSTYLIKQAEAGEPQLQAVLPDSIKRFRTFGRGEMRR